MAVRLDEIRLANSWVQTSIGIFEAIGVLDKIAFMDFVLTLCCIDMLLFSQAKLRKQKERIRMTQLYTQLTQRISF